MSPSNRKIIQALIEVAKEAREVCAAWSRATSNSASTLNSFYIEMRRVKIADGFGVRLQDRIAAAELEIMTETNEVKEQPNVESKSDLPGVPEIRKIRE